MDSSAPGPDPQQAGDETEAGAAGEAEAGATGEPEAGAAGEPQAGATGEPDDAGETGPPGRPEGARLYVLDDSRRAGR